MAETVHLPPIRISADPKEAEALRQLLKDVPQGMNVAAWAALRKIKDGIRARLAQKIGEVVNLKAADIKKTISTKGPSIKDPTLIVNLSREHSVWLAQYLSARQRTAIKNRRGKGKRPATVNVKVFKTLSRQPYGFDQSKAFTGVTPHSSNVGVFQRIGKKRSMKSGRYKGKVREVIRRLKGPSPLTAFMDIKGESGATAVDEIMQEMEQRLTRDLHSAALAVLEGKIKPGRMPPNTGE